MIIPGYGCLNPTFNELSMTKKKNTINDKLIASLEMRIIFLLLYISTIVYMNNMMIGIKDINPKL